MEKYRTQLSGVGSFLGNYITKQDELWAMLLLEPSLDPEESDRTVENKIWNARRVLDLLFHADKGFVSKDVSILVKKQLNAALLMKSCASKIFESIIAIC